MQLFKITLLFLGLFFVSVQNVGAQEVYNDYQGTWRAKVVEVIGSETREIPGTDAKHLFQTIRAEVLDGPKKGEV
ncbi:MAG: hypothetical protein RL292_491, partial [Candidatus Parcubacteria bacterium]